jgi:hypothetical protein
VATRMVACSSLKEAPNGVMQTFACKKGLRYHWERCQTTPQMTNSRKAS